MMKRLQKTNPIDPRRRDVRVGAQIATVRVDGQLWQLHLKEPCIPTLSGNQNTGIATMKESVGKLWIANGHRPEEEL